MHAAKSQLPMREVPSSSTDLYTSFNTRTRHVLIDSLHRRAQDSHHNYRVYFGTQDDTEHAMGESLRNVVSVQVIDAEVPRTADNIIYGQNVMHVAVGGNDHTVTAKPGLYLSELAISNALLDAFGLAFQGSDVVWDVEITTANRLRLYCSHPFAVNPPVSHTNRSLPFQLGIIAAPTSVASVANDNHGLASAEQYPYMIEATRFTNLMPRSYVDVVVPQVPRAGTKLTNAAGGEYVLARIPLGSTPGGAEHYEPGETLLLRERFSPITLPYLTIQLFGSDGKPYDSRDTPHRITLEIVQLADPIIPEEPPPKPPQMPKEITLTVPANDTPSTWIDQHKWNIVTASTAALLTIYIVGRLRDVMSRASAPRAPAPAFPAPAYRHIR